MPFLTRLRRPGTRKAGAAALTVALAVLLPPAARNHPDSIFHHRTDFNRDVDFLFKILIWAGTAVFIFVEAILVWTLIKFRQRPDQPEPEHVHGNTTLEIAWTVIPALILDRHRRADGPDDLQDAGEGDGRRAAGRGDRPPVVVGVPLPAVHDAALAVDTS